MNTWIKLWSNSVEVFILILIEFAELSKASGSETPNDKLYCEWLGVSV